MKTVTIPLCPKLLLMVAMLGVLAFASCRKEGVQAITSEEAAEVISQSVTDEESGAITSLESEASGSDNGTDSAEFVINDSVFISSGKVVSTLRRKLTFTRETTFRALKVVVNRAHSMIVSGNLEITIQGTNSEGAAFYYTGILTFHGNNNGTLVLQDGQTFKLRW